MTSVERARVAEMEEEIRTLRMENELLPKIRDSLCSEEIEAEGCALVDAERAVDAIG